MRTLKLTLFLLSFLSVLTGQAQELFRVMATKGGSQVAKTAAAADKKNIVTGQKLYNDESLTIPAGAYLALVHKSGKTIELKQAGSFNVNDISAKVSANNVTFTQKYSEYVLNELTKGDKADINADHKKHMNVTGSVERDVKLNELVKLYLPSKSELLSSQSSISWGPVKDAKGYDVKFTNMFEEVLYSASTADTSYSFDLSTMKLGTEKSILVTVSVKDNAKVISSQHFINIVEGPKAADIKSKETKLKEELGNDQTSPLNALLLASFYDQNNLFLDAATNYQRAIKLEPGVTEYATAYNDFLIRNSVGRK
jgi:LEA14-like dessication related protein